MAAVKSAIGLKNVVNAENCITVKQRNLRGDKAVTEELREGYYKDSAGNWQPDRRSGVDRRAIGDSAFFHERRGQFRRQVDRERFEKDHKQMIEDALCDFAQEHEGHL